MFGALDGIVSSTRIREVLLAGDVEAAAEMLARPYQLNGVVVEGERRGRDLGFPTANLEIESKRLIPANGVYAGWALVDGERHPSAINIGVRPTFSETERRVEAHLLDFEGDLYGQKLAVDFVARLRPEQKFDGIEALRNQIAQDVHAARARLT